MQSEAVELLPVVTIRHRVTDQEMVVNLHAYLAGWAGRYANWSLSGRHPLVEPPETGTEVRIAAGDAAPADAAAPPPPDRPPPTPVPPAAEVPAPRRRRGRKRKPRTTGGSR